MIATRIGIAALAMLLAWPAHPQQSDKRAREAMMRLQQANQRLSGEKSQLEQDKTRLEKEKADLAAAGEGLRRSVAAAKGELGRTARERDALAEKLADLEQRHAALTRRQAETEENLRQREADKQRLQAMLDQQRQTIGRQAQSLQACGDNNRKLHAIGMEVLEKYRDKGCGEALLQAEPFTGMKRVELENLVQDYRERLDAGRHSTAAE